MKTVVKVCTRNMWVIIYIVRGLLSLAVIFPPPRNTLDMPMVVTSASQSLTVTLRIYIASVPS